MKPFLRSLFALAAIALLVFAGGTPAPESSFASNSVVQPEPAIEPAQVIADLPTDVLSLENGSIVPVSMSMPVAPTTPTTSNSEPPPGLLTPKVTEPVIRRYEPSKPVQQSYGSCNSGSCGVRRGLFGRRR